MPSTGINLFLVGGTRSTPGVTTCSSGFSSTEYGLGFSFGGFDVGTTSTRPPPGPTPRKVYLCEWVSAKNG